MDYQYQQMPQQPMVNPIEIKKAKQAKVFSMCDKLGEVFGSLKFTRALIKPAEIISYIIMASCFVLSLLFLILDKSVISFLPYIPFLFSILAICNKKILPIAINVSFIALLYLGMFIRTIIAFADIGKYGYSPDGASVTNFIFLIVEFAAFVVLSIFVWQLFANSLTPKMPYYIPQNAAPQQYSQPVAAPVAAPVAQPVAAPVAAPAAPAPQAAPTQEAITFCPKCGVPNTAGSAFCKSCGAKLG